MRSGLPTIKKTCEFLCAFLAVYIPVIKRVFPDETELHTTLELLAVTVCSVVVLADEALPVGD
jgi:hypothetical protein